MKRRKKNYKQKRKSSSYLRLTLFQKPGIKFFKSCPLSGKDAPVIDYKNIKVLKKGGFFEKKSKLIKEKNRWIVTNTR